MSVAHAIYEVIRRHTPSHVYCVPGESYLALLNEFGASDGPKLVTTRHEEGAGLMAEAQAKLTGEVGTVLVTRGPGLTHLSIALHTAHQDSTPLVAFVGQVPTDVKHREGFQEMDIVTMTTPLAKWGVEITDNSRAVELVEEAYRVAASGRPGPVVVALPEDIDRDELSPSDSWSRLSIVSKLGNISPDQRVIELIDRAEQPAIIAGRPAATYPGVREAIVGLAETLDAPVYNAWRRFDAFDNTHTHFAGNLPILSPQSAELLKDSDLIVLVDDRLDEFSSLSYAFPTSNQTLLLVGGENSGLNGGSGWEHYLAELRKRVAARPSGADGHRAKAVAARHDFSDLEHLDEDQLDPAHPLLLAKGFVESLPENGILVTDVGTFASWLYRPCRLTPGMRFLGPTAGGMGYGLPAAIASRITCPEQPVFAIAGDGGFAMTLSEMETARREAIDSIGVFVFDNEIYGTIAAHQDRHFPSRRVGVDLGPIDYESLADAFGWEFALADSAESMAAAVARVTQGGRVLVHVPIPRDELDPLTMQWPRRVSQSASESNATERMSAS